MLVGEGRVTAKPTRSTQQRWAAQSRRSARTLNNTLETRNLGFVAINDVRPGSSGVGGNRHPPGFSKMLRPRKGRRTDLSLALCGINSGCRDLDRALQKTSAKPRAVAGGSAGRAGSV